MKNRTLLPLAAVGLAALLAAPPALATTYYWDNNGDTAGFGTAAGTWAAPTTGDATQGWSTNSTGATLPVNVTTTTSDPVNFGTASAGLAGSTITVSGTVSAGNMTFGSASGAITLSGATVTLAAAVTLAVNNSSDTISSVLAGAGTSFTVGGTGTLVLNGLNNFTGPVILGNNSAGLKVQINTIKNVGAGASSLGAPTTAANGVIQIGNTSNHSTLEFTGATAAASTERQVRIGRSGTGSGSAIILNNNADPTYTLTFSNTAFNVVASTSGGGTRFLTLGGSNTGDNLIAGQIINNTGSGGTTISLNKIDAGTWVLAGATGTYVGNTTISGGILKVGAANNLPYGTGKGNVVLDGGASSAGTLDLNGYNLAINGLAGTAGTVLGRVVNNATGTSKTLTVGNNNANVTFSGIVADHTVGTGTVALTKVGTGTQTLSGANTYSGGTTISDGTLVMGSAEALGGGGHALTVNGGALDMGAYPLGVSSLSGAGGSITNTAGLTVNQTAGANQFSGAIAGSGTLNKSGAGTLTLSAGHPYTGATAVDAGMLQIDGQLSGTSGVTVSNTATLKGSGSISGLITVLAGGTLAPGSSPGLLTVSNSVTMNGGSIFSLELAGYTPGAGGYDQLLMAGAADTFSLDSPTLTIDAGAFVPTNGAVFTVIAGFGTLNKTAGFNGDALTVTDNNNTEYAIGYAAGDQPNDVTLTVIPEPGTAGTVALFLAAALLRRRLRPARG